MGTLLADFWNWVWGFFVDLIDEIVDRISDGLDWLLQFVIDWLHSVWAWLGDQLGPVMEKLTPPPGLWSPFSDGFAMLSYWLPLNTMFALTLGFVTVIGVIRLLRWVKSFLPTIDS